MTKHDRIRELKILTLKRQGVPVANVRLKPLVPATPRIKAPFPPNLEAYLIEAGILP